MGGHKGGPYILFVTLPTIIQYAVFNHYER